MAESARKYGKLFWSGVALLYIGTGPLLLIILAAAVGLTDDPNPNPVGFGMLAGLTFWPSLIMILVGFARAKKQ